VAKSVVQIQMEKALLREQLSCVVDDLHPAQLRLREKMEKALSLLKDSLGSGCFLAQFWAEDKRGLDLQNLPYPHLCVPNSTLLGYRQLEGREGFSDHDILDRVWTYERKFPEWTSNVSYYRPDEYAHLSDAISCGVRGIIAFPVFESDQPKYCCAVLEIVTMEEKQDFDLETEKVVQALQVCFHYIYIFSNQKQHSIYCCKLYHKAIHSNYLKYKTYKKIRLKQNNVRMVTITLEDS